LVRSHQWDIGLSKTRYISEAGRCLVMQATMAAKPVIIVLLDSWGKLSRVGDANRISGSRLDSGINAVRIRRHARDNGSQARNAAAASRRLGGGLPLRLVGAGWYHHWCHPPAASLDLPSGAFVASRPRYCSMRVGLFVTCLVDLVRPRIGLSASNSSRVRAAKWWCPRLRPAADSLATIPENARRLGRWRAKSKGLHCATTS
jgi:hypothetical protein